MKSKISQFFFFVIALAFFPYVEGTHGYIPPGYGIRSLGMGGTATANPQDSLVLATNPAGLTFISNRIDSGLMIFNPVRSYSYTQPVKDHVNSQRDLFPIPHLSMVKQIGCKGSFGVGLYGRGGLNTTYPRDNPSFGNGNINQIVGIDYIQLFMAPSYAQQLTKNQSIGVSLIYGLQKIRVRGLQGFAPFSSSPEHVTNHGYNYAQGLGFRIGWMGELFPRIKGGIAYSSKVYMTKFRKYRGLFAEHGRIDSPAELTIGISWQPWNCVLIAFDYQYIFYKDVKSVGSVIQKIGVGNLGTSNGAGLGWNNLAIYKAGINYFVNRKCELRAGYSYGKVPYDANQIDFNLLAPAVIKHHLMVGTTYHIDDCNQLDFVYMHAFLNKKTGESSFGLGKVTHKMYQHAYAFNFAYLF